MENHIPLFEVSPSFRLRLRPCFLWRQRPLYLLSAPPSCRAYLRLVPTCKMLDTVAGNIVWSLASLNHSYCGFLLRIFDPIPEEIKKKQDHKRYWPYLLHRPNHGLFFLGFSFCPHRLVHCDWSAPLWLPTEHSPPRVTRSTHCCTSSEWDVQHRISTDRKICPYLGFARFSKHVSVWTCLGLGPPRYSAGSHTPTVRLVSGLK
jgi:hypothetical protein